MKVFTKAVYQWDGVKYILDESESIWYDYTGPVDLCCGAPQGEKDLANQQSAFFNTLTQQAQSVFGNSSSVFRDLYSSFAPIVAAGPSQEGFSAPELSALQSQAITNTGQQYNNAKQAVGERIAAYGGGNIALPSGAAIGPQLSLAEAAANQTSSQLNNINIANWETGRQNWLNAASGLAGAPGVFNPASGYSGTAVSGGNAASNTWNNVAQSDNSWVNALIGAGAGIAGAAAGAYAGK